MWVEKKKNGTFNFRERFQNPLTLKFKTYTINLEKNTAATRKLASAKLLEKFKNDFVSIRKDLTLRELRDLYLSFLEPTVKHSTFARNKHSTNTSMKILGADVIGANLSAGYIKSKFQASGRSNSTINEFMVRFKAWMHWCYKNDFLENIDFLNKIDRLPDVSIQEKISDKFLESEEVKSIIKDLLLHGHYTHSYFVEFMCNSGLRAGELIALEKKDIDRNNLIISINKTYDNAINQITTPKTFGSIREIPLTPKLIEIIDKVNAFNKELKIFNFRQQTIFKNPITGGYYNLATINKALKNSAARVGIEKKVTSHVLRHTYASLLMENGFHKDTIARLLGHVNSNLTNEIYLHVTQKLKEKEFEAIRNVAII